MLTNPIRCAAMAAALGLVGLVSADGTLKNVSVDKSGPGVSVHIKGKDLAQPTKVWAKKGNSLVLEFDGDLAGKQAYTPVHKAGLNSIYVQRRSGQNKVRVYLAFDVRREAKLTKTADGWDVTIGRAASKQSVAAKAPKSGGSVQPSVPPMEPAAFTPAQPRFEAPVVRGPSPEAVSRVSLDFVNTEVVQILKALAMQTGVNIVTAPDVKGTLTVTLDDVSVKDALDMVTSVAGLRYASVGNSYIVATPDKIAAASSALSGRKVLMMETRVVPIYSGSGREIRASVLSSMTDASAFGDFQMFLPNEDYKLEKSKETSSEGDKQSTNVEVSKDPTAAARTVETASGEKSQVSVKGMKEQYLVLVGPSDKIDEVEDRIKELDRSISKAYGFDTSADTKLVRRSYMLRSDDVKASDLVKAVAATQPNNFLNVDMYATPASFDNQSVVLIGRESEVAKAEALLKDLDQSGYGNEVFMYDVQHSDPRALRESLVAQIKGLRVQIPPASAGNTQIYEEGKLVAQAQETTDAGGAQGGSTNATTKDTATKDVNDESYGLTRPFSNIEKAAVPMKLILTGTHEDIEEAKSYLSQVDVPARQVALELRVMELSKEDALRIGLDWDVSTGSAAVRTVNLNHGIANPTSSATVRIGGRGWGASVTATLDQIANQNNLIARPNLLALDGREAEIFVGDVIRYVESIQSTQNGVTVVTGKVPVGVRLAVLPRIGRDHMTLDLRPSVSNLKGFTEISDGNGGAFGQLPQTSLRTAQSTVAINDGDTIAIGGLIQEQDLKNMSKVPLLGDLPIIGRLFRKTENSKVRREVVLFLTAKVVGANAGTAADPRVSDLKYPAESRSAPKP